MKKLLIEIDKWKLDMEKLKEDTKIDRKNFDETLARGNDRIDQMRAIIEANKISYAEDLKREMNERAAETREMKAEIDVLKRRELQVSSFID
jgi:hypothetical protein